MWATLFPDVCLGCARLVSAGSGVPLCARCRLEQQALPPGLARLGHVDSLYVYDGPLRRAVVALKFGGALALAGPLGQMLAGHPRLVSSPDGAPIDLVLPVPLHWRRRLVRGFDQAEQLAYWALRRQAGGAGRRARPGPVLGRGLLRRSRPTVPQTRLDAAERHANVAGAFVVTRPRQVSGRRILLVDDVTTTGATVDACRQTLLSAGAADVHALTLLRAI